MTRGGPDVLNPNQVAGVLGWWAWKTGITDTGGFVEQWDDQSGLTNTIVDLSSTTRPAYNSATGAITPNAIDDRLIGAPNNDVAGEITFVLECPTTPNGNPFFGKPTNNAGGDFDSLNFSINASKQLNKIMLIGSNPASQSIEALTSGVKTVVSFSNAHSSSATRIFINGSEVTYSSKTIGNSWQGSNAGTFWALFQNGQNTAFSNTILYEMSWHDRELTNSERRKLVDYFMFKHGI